MPLDLQSLSTDTLLYMLLHSGVFVAAMGAVFFIVGLLFGFATWGRFKNRARAMAAELDLQREEIATLRRKLGEQTVKPGGAAMATETIPMPPASLPAPVVAPAPLPPPSPQLPAEPITDTISTAELVNGTAPAKTKSSKPRNAVKAKAADAKTAIEPVAEPPGEPVIVPVLPEATPPPAEPPAVQEDEAPKPTVEPENAPHTSPLAAIIAAAPHPPEKPEEAAPPAPDTFAPEAAALDVLPALPELPASPSADDVKPENDPKLGLVFKSPPARSDDLTAMKGIAKVLEQRLHEFGIYTYRQIALWNEEQIREFSSRLAFKDRIHREKWVEQARQLHAEKHGEPL